MTISKRLPVQNLHDRSHIYDLHTNYIDICFHIPLLEFCYHLMASTLSCSLIMQLHWELSIADANAFTHCRYNEGHSINARVRSCFCSFCKYGEGESCPRESYVGPWYCQDVVNVSAENAKARIANQRGVQVCSALRLRQSTDVFVAVRCV